VRILTTHILREFSKVFLLCLLGLLALYYIVDIFDRIEIFIRYDAPLLLKFEYFLYKLPLILYQVVPVSLLISIVVVIGIMTRHNELTAIKAGGIDLYSLTIPLVLYCLGVSMLVFVNNEYLLPSTNRRATHIYNVKIKGKPPRGIFRQSRVWFASGKDTIFNVQILDPKNQVLEGVTLIRFDGSYNPRERIDAMKAYPAGEGEWIFENVVRRRFKEGGFRIDQVENLPSLRLPIRESLEDFYKYKKKPDEMNYRELKVYIERLKTSGYNSVPYQVDLLAKTSIPFISFIVAFLSIPLAVKTGRHGGIVSSIGLCIAIGVAYWLILSIGLSLGHAGRLSPFMAAWAANIIFCSAGLYLYANLRQ
jgi:lipopolysaccharide export system permease protein